MKLAKALGPSYFRVGGTKCDVTYFDPDQQHYTSDLQSGKCHVAAEIRRLCSRFACQIRNSYLIIKNLHEQSS